MGEWSQTTGVCPVSKEQRDCDGCGDGGRGVLPAAGTSEGRVAGRLLGSAPLQSPWWAFPGRTAPATWPAPADLSRGAWGIEPGVGRRRGKYVVRTMATKCVKRTCVLRKVSSNLENVIGTN